MADIIARFKGDTSDLDQKIKKGSQTLLQMKADCEKVGGAFINLEKNEVDFIKSLGQMETGAKSAKGTIAELSKAFTDMSAVYNRLSEEEKRDEGGKALRTSLDQLKERIKEGKAELKNIDGEIGNSQSLLGQLSGKFGINIKQLGGWGAALGAGKIALDVMKDAFFASEQNVDEWGRTMEGAKGLYTSFTQALNNADLGNFFSNMDSIIQRARDAYDALDKLKTNTGIIGNEEARLNALRAKYQKIYRDPKSSPAQKAEAAKGLADIQKQKAGATRETMELNNDHIKKALREQLSTLTDAEYKQLYPLIVQSLYDTNAANKLNNTTVTHTSKQLTADKYGKMSYQDVDRKINVGSLLTDKFREWLNPYIQQYWNSYGKMYQDERADNRIIGSGTGGGGTATTTAPVKEILPKAVVTESLTELQILEDQLKTVKNSMKGYGKGTEEWKAMNEEAKSLADQIARINGDPLKPVETSSLSQLQIMEDQLATIKASMQNADYPEDWKEMADEAERMEKAIKKFKGETDPKKAFSLTDNNYYKGASSAIGGVAQIGSGLEGIGVNLGDGFNKTVSAIQSVFTIVEGVQAIITAIQLFQSTNDTIQTGLLSAISFNTGVMATTSAIKSVPIIGEFLHSGGIVHAAQGVFVPGTPNGGRDTVPAMLSPGELVLNMAQQSSLASKLQQGGGEFTGQPYVQSEMVFLGINNHLKRSGQGEIITAKNIHKYIR